MTIGAGLFLIAVGAILRFGVTTAFTHGFSVHTIGDILMIIGALGVVLWLVVWVRCAGVWGGRGARGAVVRLPGRPPPRRPRGGPPPRVPRGRPPPGGPAPGAGARRTPPRGGRGAPPPPPPGAPAGDVVGEP